MSNRLPTDTFQLPSSVNVGYSPPHGALLPVQAWGPCNHRLRELQGVYSLFGVTNV